MSSSIRSKNLPQHSGHGVHDYNSFTYGWHDFTANLWSGIYFHAFEKDTEIRNDYIAIVKFDQKIKILIQMQKN